MFKEIYRHIIKDFKIEFRNRIAFNLAFSFSGVTTIAISLVIGGTPISFKIKAILLWIIIFFSAMSGLAHIFIREEEERTSLFLKVNSSPEVVYLSKLIFNIIFFMIIESVIAPLFIFFLQLKVEFILLFILTLFTGGIAISSSTTILAAIVAKSGGKSSLFTILSFPILLPIIWIAISTTINSLDQYAVSYGNILFFLAFSGVIIAFSYLLFRFIWLDE